VTRLTSVKDANRVMVNAIVLSGFAILFTFMVLSEPDIDWDLIAYVANATQYLSDQPIEALQTSVYGQLKNTVSAEDYARLTGSPSRAVISEDPEAFRQTIAFFYDTRIVYTGLVAGLMSYDVNPFFACYLVSVASAVLSVFFLARMVPVKLPMALAFAIPFITLSFGLLDVARSASPDALAALAIIICYWMLFRKQLLILLVLLPLIIYVRTDLILIAALFQGYLLLGNRISRVLVVISGMSTIAAYLILNHVIIEGDPWSSLIGYNYGTKPTHPEDYAQVFGVKEYMSYLLIGLKSYSYNPVFFAYCALTTVGVSFLSHSFLENKNKASASDLQWDLFFVLVSSALYIVLHFLLFPVTWIRFFAAQYSLVAVVVLWASLWAMSERTRLSQA